jgi:hypothetical protein
MTPEAAIAALDRHIARDGQTVMLRKGAAADASGDKALQAFVRGYQPEELAGGIQQGDTTAVFSPSALTASGFDGVPKRLDRMLIAGKMQVIQVCNPVRMRDVVVRYETWLRGA